MRAEQIVEEETSGFETRAAAALEHLPGRAELGRVDRRVRKFVAEKPIMAVCLALATGYVVGRALSRLS
jgi:hypothetical protein